MNEQKGITSKNKYPSKQEPKWYFQLAICIFLQQKIVLNSMEKLPINHKMGTLNEHYWPMQDSVQQETRLFPAQYSLNMQNHGLHSFSFTGFQCLFNGKNQSKCTIRALCKNKSICLSTYHTKLFEGIITTVLRICFYYDDFCNVLPKSGHSSGHVI